MSNEKIQLSAQAKIDRALGSSNLYYLCKEILGYKDMVPHVHGELADFVTSPVLGRFRQATVPRSWFKTWLATVGLAIWMTLPDEDGQFKDIFAFKGSNVRILIASNVIDNAAKMVNKIRSEWMNNTRLKAAFPEIVPEFNKTRWSDHCAQVKRNKQMTEGTYTAVGVGGSVISQHFDLILEDDLVYAKKDDFSGQELMPTQEDIDKAIGWHKLAFSLFANPQESCTFNVGTRWAPHDLIDYIRNNEKHYRCFEINATKEGVWPIESDDQCNWPERFDKRTLEEIRGSQGEKIFECFPAETPILLDDWSTKSISDIKIGDVVIGFTRDNSRSKLVKSTVNLVEQHVKEVVEITLDSGNIIKCTEDHPWYTNRKDRTHAEYLPAKVGRPLLQVYDCLKQPTQEELFDYRYLAGIIDGEGACNHGSIAIGQSKVANPDVYESIKSVLERLCIPYKVCKVNPNDTHILRNKIIRRGLGESFVLSGGREVKIDIVRFGKPSKAHRILKTIWSKPHNPIKKYDVVTNIRKLGKQLVYAIGTTSGNYVAWGYATKNTQYLNRPRVGSEVVFKTEYLRMHDNIADYPTGLELYTFVDLAGWPDSKKLCNNVVLTGGKDYRGHLWVHRYDAGRYNPTEVINKFKEHQKIFNSKVMIEEIQYQASVRHFATKDMEATGYYYPIEAIPYDGQRDAKNLRIIALETDVTACKVHLLKSMKQLVTEMEDYPYGATKDILDCLSFLRKWARASACEVAETKPMSPFSIDKIEEELYERASTLNHNAYPFEDHLEQDIIDVPIRGT